MSTMVGVPIRISYSNVDSIHGSIIGYEGEWRDQIYTRGYLRRDSNREEERVFTRARTHATGNRSIGPAERETVPMFSELSNAVSRRLFAQKRKLALTQPLLSSPV